MSAVDENAKTMSAFPRLRRLLAETLGVSEDFVTPDSSLRELFARSSGDSLDQVEFVMAVEEEFAGVEIPDGEAKKWEELFQTGTVQQLADFIDHLRGS